MSKKIIKRRYFKSIVESQKIPTSLVLTYGDNLGERHNELSIDYYNPNQKDNMYPNMLQIPEWHFGDKLKMKELATVIFETIVKTYRYPLYTWEDLFVELNLLDDNVDFVPEDYGYKLYTIYDGKELYEEMYD